MSVKPGSDTVVPIKIEAGTLTATSPAKTLSINQIAAQLANSKASGPTQTTIPIAPAVTAVNGNDTKSSNPIVAKMTEALSLKQSPTLTKQLAKPSTSSSSGLQVITQYMCRYCGQQFDSTDQMQKHIQEHVEGKTPHECSVCGKTYRTPSKLQRHVRVHSGERPYACSVCGRRFTRSDHVKQHMKVHFQIWEEIIRSASSSAKGGFTVTKCTRICSNHFKKTDFFDYEAKSRRLLQGSVPSVFPWIKPKPRRSPKKDHDGDSTDSASEGDQPDNDEPKDANCCHLCGGMKFTRRHALHAHLQQQHSLNQVFTCHRCGEAFESLEEMQTHKLSHDTILNSLKDGNAAAPLNGVAKFSLGMQKPDQSMNKYDFINIKPGTEAANTDDKKSSATLKVPTFFVPANMDNVSALSNKLVMEGMEKMADEAEMQKKYEEELMQLNADAKKYQDEVDRKNQEVERLKIAQAFTIKAEPGCSNTDLKGNSESTSESGIQIDGKETTHIVNGDGMAMFILPTLSQPMKQEVEKDESDMETEESEQNSSKDSSEINREGDDDKGDDEKIHDNGVGDVANGDASKSEVKISAKATGYSKPCPRSKKPGFVPIAAKTTETKTVSSEEYHTQASRSLLSTLNPKINELIKAKVEQNLVQGTMPQTTFIITNPTINQQLPKLTLIPNVVSGKIQQTSYQTILPAPSSSSVTLAAVAASVAGQSAPKKAKTESPKLIKCEHCCIWFEDNAMSMLHNTLHSADASDPFTCRKCYKKLGNRLEFMAHLIWHLEPNMDI